jgi:L-fuconolactonase
MRIDSHQHFWRLARGDYGWLDTAPAVLRRDFLPDDLAPLLAAQGIDATVLVQAAPSLAETRFLLDLAARTPWVAGVVGWVDVAEASACADLAALAADPALLGIRPMLQDIADTGHILRPEAARVLDALSETGLCFDALIRPRHLPVIGQVMRRHPGLRLVVDHGAKPAIATSGPAERAAWAAGIAALAAHPGVYCKLSGLANEAGRDWQAAALAPYVATLLDAFGPARLMWGSDWPVVLDVAAYADWHAAAAALIPPEHHAAVFGATAARFYRIGPPPGPAGGGAAAGAGGAGS